MNPMSEAWNLLKSNIEERSEIGYEEDRNLRQKASTFGLDPDDAPRQVAHPIRQQRRTGRYSSTGNGLGELEFRDGLDSRGRGDRSKSRVAREGIAHGDALSADDDTGDRGKLRQYVSASPRPTVGTVDDLSRQAGGGQRAQTSGFQTKKYGRFRNRAPKMGAAGLPQGMGAFDQPNTNLSVNRNFQYTGER